MNELSRGCLVLLFVAAHLANLPCAQAADLVVADFESGTYSGWTATGEAFGKAPATGTLPNQMRVSGYEGKYLVNSFVNGDQTTGTLTSDPFQIIQTHINFKIGGGEHANDVGIELLIDGRSIRSHTGINSESLKWTGWDVSEFVGRSASLRIFDRSTGGWGHINIDQIVQSDSARSEIPQPVSLAAYRKSADYMNEPLRPQFHFTPEINWMNDPNGMVYHNGEYHLFYQHNPLGNSWGHMSWGHAVSRDLVHWEHLPIALHEENDVMIFSGSAVVDHDNSSGFGTQDNPPLVAIYTGHQPGRQDQRIAYSTDNGRTWTKYKNNPVLDIKQSDFRDPKVMWHQPTSKWVMVVSLANEKRLQFYGSKNLKDWNLLSEFGPAGARNKPNWECPDLFELPIEGEPGKTKWVLEVDMGGGSIAGGSGGEYFVGDFDGKRFTCDTPLDHVNWVDYGRDFYAPVSWSDIPAADGRRIWLAWMNNWQTCLVPTHPWRSAMSIPRTLALRNTDNGYRMVQNPVVELQRLRGPVIKTQMAIEPGDTATDALHGDLLEIRAVFAPGTAKYFGLSLRVGADQKTNIGYDAQRAEMFVDRASSGNVDFHEKFAGEHRAPLPLIDGQVTLHIFLDRSSVEVFGNDGYSVITDRIFPGRGMQGGVFAVDGQAQLVSLNVWPLKSAVTKPDSGK